ncbi:MAG: nucleotidyltransferase domain-containing protein [Coriobacteriales bacterium]|nr:nucleotidyltransferase domain-containing protein [Coriobacteriales bacterium]
MIPIDSVYQQLVDFARLHNVRRVTLFGSRARGDALANSDIDIAVEGCPDFFAFEEDVEEHLWSLTQIDLVNLDEPVSKALLEDIHRDGTVLYEKI